MVPFLLAVHLAGLSALVDQAFVAIGDFVLCELREVMQGKQVAGEIIGQRTLFGDGEALTLDCFVLAHRLHQDGADQNAAHHINENSLYLRGYVP